MPGGCEVMIPRSGILGKMGPGPTRVTACRLLGEMGPLRVTEAAVGFAITGAPVFRLAEPGDRKAQGQPPTMRVFRPSCRVSPRFVGERLVQQQDHGDAKIANGLSLHH